MLEKFDVPTLWFGLMLAAGGVALLLMTVAYNLMEIFPDLGGIGRAGVCGILLIAVGLVSMRYAKRA